MYAGVSKEYGGQGFPKILEPHVAQVLYLVQQLRDHQHADEARQAPLQAMNLRRLFAWAHAHSPYWRALLEARGAPDFVEPEATLAQLPVLRRRDLQEHGEALSCVAALPPGSCSMAHSTGSTGQPVRTWKESEPYQLRYLAFAALTTQWHGLDRGRDLLRFSARFQDGELPNWGAPDAWYEPTGKMFKGRSLSRDMAEMYAMLKQRRPGYVTATASVLHALALHALAHDPAPPAIDAMLSTGETVTAVMRRDCLAAFGARMIDRYTCEETGWLALQCPQHEHLHVLTANVLVEIVDAHDRPCAVGVPGRVLVTALHSHAMPLIRYEIGDIAEWGEPCDCGIHLPVIKRIWGRGNQSLRAPDGTHRYLVLIAEDFLAIAPLSDIRLRYYTDPLARLEVACAAPLGAAQRAGLLAKLRELLGFDCPVELVEGPVIDWGATDKKQGFAVVDGPAPARAP